MPNAILDPTGRTSARSDTSRAPRPASLRGATIGLLDNTKQNADTFLAEVGALLLERYGAAGVVPLTKTAFALPASDELAEQIVRRCDVLVTGVGDCGSCSASAVADGIAFEGRGVPTAVICSDAFRGSAEAIAELHGAPSYHYVTTPHPVAPLSRAEVADRAADALEEIVGILVDRDAGRAAVGGNA